MTIGEKIYKLRLYSGLSQKDFADKVGASQSAINYWENGKRQPRVSQIKKIAKVFDFPLYNLLDDNYELENVELEMKRAKLFVKKHGVFIGPSEMTKPPKPPIFTCPMSSSYSYDNSINRLLNTIQKTNDGKELTQEELEFKASYFEMALRKLCDVFAKVYITLNTEGQKKADDAIDRAVEQLELLSKIPEYQRDNEHSKE